MQRRNYVGDGSTRAMSDIWSRQPVLIDINPLFPLCDHFQSDHQGFPDIGSFQGSKVDIGSQIHPARPTRETSLSDVTVDQTARMLRCSVSNSLRVKLQHYIV